MRKLFLFLLQVFAVVSISLSQVTNFRLTLSLDSVLTSDEQWCYLHSFVNEFDHLIVDSVKIDKGVREVVLAGFAPEERSFTLTFSKKGPLNLEVIVEPNDQLVINLDETDDRGGFYSKCIDGSLSTCERVEINRKYEWMVVRRQTFEGQMYAYADKGDAYLSALQDSIDKCFDEEVRLCIHVIKTSESPMNVYDAFCDKGVMSLSPDSLAVLQKIALKRFPKHSSIQSFNYTGEYPAPSIQSEHDSNRLFQVAVNRMKLMKSKEIKSDQDKQSKGRNLDFELNSLQGDRFTLSQLYGKYILVDFWASWCIPCIENMPLIKRVQTDYPETLTVCLVSLDRNRNSWKESIKRNQLENFIHLIAADEDGNLSPEISELGIRLLPANILLDKEGHIIAKDLSRDALLSTLKKLFPKQ